MTHQFKGVLDSTVVSNENPVGDIYLMRLHCPAIAETARPGQFVNIKVNQELTPLLRKPFSICRRHRQQGWIEVLWKIVGKGTEIMSRFQKGQTVNLIGPLGRAYSLPTDGEIALLVGGGLGVAPLPFLCEELLSRELQAEVFLGAKTADELSMIDFFEERGIPLEIATEDGSVGQQGLVTELVTKRLDSVQHPNDFRIYSCGPTGFLNAMMAISSKYGVPGQLAIETLMACGFGICMGCAVRENTDEPRYKLTCIDGPVFDAGEIILDD